MTTYPKITVGLVLYEGQKYLPFSIASLLQQDYPGEIEFLLRDQSPHGEAKQFLETQFPEVFPAKIRIETGENRLHSGGHNALMRRMSGAYYICASNDMRYAPDALTKLIEALEDRPDYAAAAGKSLIWDFQNDRLTGRIDTAGLRLTPAHHFFDLGQGEVDHGQYDGQTEVIGASGAFFAIRKTALELIALDGQAGEQQFFDECLHYKNDCDLFYRLYWAGGKCLFVPAAKVWHDRQASEKKQSAGNRQAMSTFVKADSLFGQMVVSLRHGLAAPQPFSTKILTLCYLKARLLFALLREPRSLSAVRKYWRLHRELKRKDRLIRRTATADGLSAFYKRSVMFGRLPALTSAEAIILDYFKAERVKKNVASLLKQQTAFDLRLVVADNSHSEQNAAILQTLKGEPKVKVVIHPGNLGYARGNNQAAKASKGEVIFIVNPDIISPDPHTLQTMADYLIAHPEVAIVGPKQRNPDGTYEKTARRFPTLVAQLARRSFLKRFPFFQTLVKSYEFTEMDMETTQEVDWLQSSFWAVRKDFWDYLGGFDEYYAIFMADVEMCWQAWAKGMKVVYLADAQVEADGIRCSRGTIFSIFKSRMIRIHSIDAVKFWWKHLFQKNPRF